MGDVPLWLALSIGIVVGYGPFLYVVWLLRRHTTEDECATIGTEQEGKA
jgi:hypothetical protein